MARTMPSPEFKPKGLSFQALLTAEGLQQFDQLFLEYLKKTDKELFDFLDEYRKNPLPALKVSHFILRCAPILEEFIAEAFDIEEAVQHLQAVTLQDDPIFAFNMSASRRNPAAHVRSSCSPPSCIASDSVLYTVSLKSSVEKS